MNTTATKTSLFALAAAALLSLNVGAATAREFNRPNADVRAVTTSHVRPEYNALALGTRSVTNDAADNAWTSYAGSTSMSRH